MNSTQKKLHIAIVSDAVYPYNVGGKEKRIYELSKRLVSRGHRVTVYCMKWWKEDTFQVLHNGVTFEAISPYYPLYVGERRSIKEALFFALHTLKLLRKDFDVIDIDHMPHLVLFPTKIVSLLKRKKMIATWHEVWGRNYWKKYLGKMGTIAYGIEFISIKLPGIIIAASSDTAERLAVDFNRRKNVYQILNGIDAQQMDQITTSTKKTDLMFAGRLLDHKNVNLLIHAVKDLKKTYPNITCLIIGNGPEEKRLKALTQNLKLENNIIFQDFLKDNEDFFALIKSSKVFVLPSNREGFGIAALESLALGVPVVTYNHVNNGARNLIIEGENGYLFDGGEKSLANAIQTLIEKNLSSDRVKATAQKYDWERIVTQIEEVYRL